ncbi:MAG: 50S ribosomal protein L1 [Verrucomicrobiia bacterium]|jgi:large subunit ribosomal protein L1
MNRSKRYRKALELVDKTKVYPLKTAIELLTKMPKAKFNETVELAFRLGVDPKQSDQMVRGTVSLPHGTGKQVRVLVFTKNPAAAEAAKTAGADFVGFEDLIKKCNEGWADFDVAIATPDAMGEVRKLGKVLGPKGLMPNPKTGTVTEDTAKAVKEFKAGRVEFKVDKAGNLQLPIGKISFTKEQIEENARAAIEAIVKARPASLKGKYIHNVAISATMSPSVKIDQKDILTA